MAQADSWPLTVLVLKRLRCLSFIVSGFLSATKPSMSGWSRGSEDVSVRWVLKVCAGLQALGFGGAGCRIYALDQLAWNCV